MNMHSYLDNALPPRFPCHGQAQHGDEMKKIE